MSRCLFYSLPLVCTMRYHTVLVPVWYRFGTGGYLEHTNGGSDSGLLSASKTQYHTTPVLVWYRYTIPAPVPISISVETIPAARFRCGPGAQVYAS